MPRNRGVHPTGGGGGVRYPPLVAWVVSLFFVGMPAWLQRYISNEMPTQMVRGLRASCMPAPTIRERHNRHASRCYGLLLSAALIDATNECPPRRASMHAFITISSVIPPSDLLRYRFVAPSASSTNTFVGDGVAASSPGIASGTTTGASSRGCGIDTVRLTPLLRGRLRTRRRTSQPAGTGLR
jgi:hypothetical protein